MSEELYSPLHGTTVTPLSSTHHSSPITTTLQLHSSPAYHPQINHIYVSPPIARSKPSPAQLARLSINLEAQQGGWSALMSQTASLSQRLVLVRSNPSSALRQPGRYEACFSRRPVGCCDGAGGGGGTGSTGGGLYTVSSRGLRISVRPLAPRPRTAAVPYGE